jgi:hypothetical protein
MEKDAAWAPEAHERPTFGVGKAVVDLPPGRIEVFASRQWQSASRLGVDILRIHRFLQSWEPIGPQP